MDGGDSHGDSGHDSHSHSSALDSGASGNTIASSWRPASKPYQPIVGKRLAVRVTILTVTFLALIVLLVCIAHSTVPPGTVGK